MFEQGYSNIGNILISHWDPRNLPGPNGSFLL